MTENILIVDDEPDLELLIRQRFRKAIRASEYCFYFANNGIEALKIISANPISIVVTDINMPQMDGLELLKRINAMNIPALKVIIVSAYSDMANIRIAMNSGAFDFLTKPVDLNDLEKTILKTLETIKVIRRGIESREKLIDYDRELDAAKEIQQAILPKVFPPFPQIKAFDIYGQMEATKQVGGDFFDFFLIDSNKLGFVIGDVSGKGVPSSIFMAVARTLIHSFGIAGYSTAECLKLTNKILCDHSVDSMFVTVFYGILDITTGEVTYTNAGHNYPFIVSGLGVIQALTQGSSIILGIFEDAEFILNTIKLEPNTSILLYTDGVTESMDEFNNQLGEEALSRHIKKLTTIGFDRPNPKFIVNSVFDLVKQHARNSSKQSDDITVLCITYYG